MTATTSAVHYTSTLAQGQEPLGPHFGSHVILRQDPQRSYLVGMAGFEPAASCSQSRRANQAALHPVLVTAETPVTGPFLARRTCLHRALELIYATTPATASPGPDASS